MLAAYSLWSWLEGTIDQLHRWLDGNQWLATWLIGIGTAVLAIGVLIAVWGLRDARKTRDGELLADLSRRWSEPAMEESLMAHSSHGPVEVTELVERLYGAPSDAPPAAQQDVELFTKLARWPDLIESIAVMNHHGSITTRAVYRMWGSSIIGAWALWSLPAQKLRDLGYAGGGFPYFEKLVAKMTRSARAQRRWYRRLNRRLKEALLSLPPL